MAQREIQHVVEHAIDELPEAFRIVFITRVIEGMNVEETADILGLKPETVKTRLHRARKMLDDLAVVEPEDIHDRQSQFAGLTPGMNVEDHEIAVGEHALDLATKLGKLLLQFMQERSKAFDAVLNHGVVLNVLRAKIDGGAIEIGLVHRCTVNCKNSPFGGLGVIFSGARRG